MRQLIIRLSRAIFNWPPSPASVAEKLAVIQTFREKSGAEVFVETGTFQGEMIDAQRTHFEKLISIELSEELYQAARAKFAEDDRIHLHQGDSGVKLREAIKDLTAPALFWLDAHYSAGITAGRGEKAPIIKELSCLTSRNQPDDVILIDDARLFGLKLDYPRLEVIRRFARENWPNHSFQVKSDIICIIPSHWS